MTFKTTPELPCIGAPPFDGPGVGTESLSLDEHRWSPVDFFTLAVRVNMISRI
jgi:hypothetical protein